MEGGEGVVGELEVGGGEDVWVDAELVEGGGDVVARAGDVGDVEVGGGGDVDRNDGPFQESASASGDRARHRRATPLL